MKLPPDFDFRPHPNRSIFLSGVIDQSALDRVFPEIIRIESSGPITLYLDSPGGSVIHANRLQRMLAAPNQDASSRRRLLTVATGFVASAAADLLMAGDYTLAYEHAVIMMHGVRQASDTDITTEAAASLARSLAFSNEQFALALAANCVSTFFFRVTRAFDSFEQIRHEQSDPNLRDVECFIAVTGAHISHEVVKLLKHAATQCVEMEALDDSVRRSLKPLLQGDNGVFRPAEIEAAIFRAILDHELKTHPDPSWSFGEHGFEGLQQKVQLLGDQNADRHSRQVATLRDRWGMSFLTTDEAISMGSQSREQWNDSVTRVCEPRIRQFWFLLVAICRGLQTADFYLSAEEAYWLGFVDEVIGRLDLPSPRIFAEYLPDDESTTETI